MSKATFRLRCDPRAGEYRLIVEYASTAPAEEHEAEHRRIMEMGRELLIGNGLDPAQVEVRCERLSVAEPAAENHHGDDNVREPKRIPLGRDS